MKKFLVALLILVLGFSFSACGKQIEKAVKDVLEQSGVETDEDGNATKTITSPESSLTLSYPLSWSNLKGELNDDASIELGNPIKEQYLVVIEETDEDFVDDFNVDVYMGMVMDYFLTSIDLDKEPDIQKIKIGKEGIDARQTRISGAVDNIKAEYIYSCLENDGVYYQIIAWSIRSKFDDAEPIYMDVLASITFLQSEDV